MTQNIIYIDTEFIRYADGIQLISIGLVKTTGEAYYAISSEFNPQLASPWVRENVLPALEKQVQRKTLAEIATDISAFVGRQVAVFWGYMSAYDWWLVLQLYGGDMQEMPYNLPVYCRELRQEIERQKLTEEALPARPTLHNALADAHWGRQVGGILGIH